MTSLIEKKIDRKKLMKNLPKKLEKIAEAESIEGQKKGFKEYCIHFDGKNVPNVVLKISKIIKHEGSDYSFNLCPNGYVEGIKVNKNVKGRIVRQDYQAASYSCLERVKAGIEVLYELGLITEDLYKHALEDGTFIIGYMLFTTDEYDKTEKNCDINNVLMKAVLEKYFNISIDINVGE